MKKLTTCLIILLSSFIAYGQTGIYKTYEDYVSGKMDKMEDVQVSALFSLNYKFTKPDGSFVTYHPSDFWGFVFKGNLFRSVRGLTAMLQDSGKVCYYLNGEAATDMVHYGREKAFAMTPYNASCYVSTGDMNAKMYAMLLKPFDKNSYLRFKKDYPGLAELMDCLKKPASVEDYKKIRECVKDYNQKK